MGCASSTEVVTDMNGKEKKKKRLGGAYPGQRRPQHQPYAPPASDFGKDGQATAHFIAYGGGNALTLVKQDGTAQPETGGPKPQYIQVTLPAGVSAGQTIHVQAPDGQVNAIVVPPGFGPGSTFTVEFAPSEVAPPTAVPINEKYGSGATSGSAAATYQSHHHQAPPPPANAGADDGFASGFHNPNWTPPPSTAPTASAQAVPAGEPEVYVSGTGGGAYGSNNNNYPSATARPVYSSHA